MKSYNTFTEWLDAQPDPVSSRMETISGQIAWDAALKYSEHVQQLVASHRIKMGNERLQPEPVNQRLLEALKDLFADYKKLADSGDAGFWSLEDLPVGKQAMEAIAAAEEAPQPPDSDIPWDLFPCWLIDHCEGDMITEEGLQRALADMIKHHVVTVPDVNDDDEGEPQAPASEPVELDAYDAGHLNDFGGGNVGWWQDYIRSELDRAHEFYQEQVASIQKPQPPAVPDGYALGKAVDASIIALGSVQTALGKGNIKAVSERIEWVRNTLDAAMLAAAKWEV